MQGLRQGLRTLARAPGFTALAVLTLAAGIGATTTMFSLANALFLRPLPHVDQARLVELNVSRGDRPVGWSYPNVEDARIASAALEIAALADRAISLRGDGDAVTALAHLVSSNYFRVLGVEPARGRFFVAEDDVPGTAAVVISHTAWQQHFGGDPAVIGRTARVNGRPATVIGVAPEGFIGTFTGFRFDVWAPLSMVPVIAPGVEPGDRSAGWLEAVARLPDGMPVEGATAALDVVAQRLSEAHPAENGGLRIEAGPVSGFDEDIRTGALGLTALLLAVAGLVLAIACANVAGMLLARGVSRQRELAIRRALGADRRRLARMLIAETTVVTLAGGAAGVVLAAWGTDLMGAFRPPLPVPVVLDPTVDGIVIAFALGVTALAALGAGLLPAFRAVGRGSELLRTRTGDDRGTSRVWRGFVIAQIAGSLVLLATAGLFVRTVQHAGGAGLGFETEGVAVRPLLDMGLIGLDDDEAAGTYSALLTRIEAGPGVEAAALTSRVPLGLGGASTTITVDGVDPPADADGHEVSGTAVTPRYFAVMSTELHAGRGFTEADRPGAPDVAIVSEAFARRFWPGENAIGKRIGRDDRRIEIVGVAADVRLSRSEAASSPYLYLPYAQWPSRRMDLLVREAASGAAIGSVRNAMREVTPDLPAVEMVPLAQHTALSLLPQRIAAVVAAVLGGVGALLAALGVYGLVAFTVGRRRREIGIRMAMGADTGDIVRTVMGEVIGLAGIGLAAGLVSGLVAARAIGALLYGVSPADPIAFAAAAAVVMLFAVAGSLVPARQAVRIPPVAAMAAE
jgi:predicted permease